MAMKKKVAARVAARKQAVGAMKKKGVKAGEARKRFYVQTRAAELSAKGEKVDKAKRQELRKKFESGSVARAGFYKKGERKSMRGGSSSSSSSSKTSGSKSSTVTLPSGATVKPVRKDMGGRSRSDARAKAAAARKKRNTPPVR